MFNSVSFAVIFFSGLRVRYDQLIIKVLTKVPVCNQKYMDFQFMIYEYMFEAGLIVSMLLVDGFLLFGFNQQC